MTTYLDRHLATIYSPTWRNLTLCMTALLGTHVWGQAPGFWKPELQAAEPKSLLGKTSLSGMKLNLDGFRIEGDVLIDQQGLSAVLKPWLERELSLAEFEQAVQAISTYLRANGHPKAVVKVSRAMMRDGQIAVAIEGLSPRAVDYVKAPVAEPVLSVKGFRFKGVTKATPDELELAVAPWTGKPLKVSELQAPAQAVAQLLRAKGYTLAQAFMPPQKMAQGILEIEVHEGQVDTTAGVDGVVVFGAQDRIRPEVIQKILSRSLLPGQPLRPADLENRLLVANDLPGVQVSAGLVAGHQPGTTQIEASVKELSMVSGQVTLDTYGSRYTGRDRSQLQLSLNSPTGWGDQLQLQAVHSAKMNSHHLSWSLPVGWDGARIGLSQAGSDLSLDTQVVPVNLDGRSRSGNVFASYPLMHTPFEKISSQATYESRRLSNTLDSTPLNDRQLRVLNLGVMGESIGSGQDSRSWNINFSSGQVENVFDLGQALQMAGTAGHYNKLNAGLQFTRGIALDDMSSQWKWQVNLSGQSSSKNLDTSEKFQLGGPSGVRAYPLGEAFGDLGYLVNIELHRQLNETPLGAGSVFGFTDVGGIQLSRTPWDTQIATGKPNNYQLRGMGMGASINPAQRATFKLMWARKIGSNPNPTAALTDSDGSQSNSRIWLLGTYKF